MRKLSNGIAARTLAVIAVLACTGGPAAAQWGYYGPAETYNWQGVYIREGAFGMTSVTNEPSEAAAHAQLKRQCAENGWTCRPAEVTNEECIAVAYVESTGYYTWSPGSKEMSEFYARTACKIRNRECQIFQRCGKPV